MIKCPNCNKPLGAHVRECNHCGAQLMTNYFSKPAPKKTKKTAETGGIGSAISLTFGVFGCIALLAAVGFHMAALFGFGPAPTLDLHWWVYTFVFVMIPAVYLASILALKGARFSILFDYFWLFISVVGAGLCVQWYLTPSGMPLFYGIDGVPYLLAAGYFLIIIASVITILGYRKPVKQLD